MGSSVLAVLKSLILCLFLGLGGYSQIAAQDNRQLSRENTAERRIALVIGNGAYASVPRLRNPSSDARLIAATLTKLGFEVATGTDKTQREMKQMIREFGKQLRSGRTVSVFYFAGHGVQAKGRNYLIPVDAEIQTEADLEDTAVDLNYILNVMDDAQNALNIAILDACRNNPFARSFRSSQNGLAQVVAPNGTLIAYATAPNSVAADGAGANSPYTEELTRQMAKPGVLLETMFRRLTEQVSARTDGRQEPWYSANVKGDFYFASGPVTSFNDNQSGNVIPPTVQSAGNQSLAAPLTGPPEKAFQPTGGAHLLLRSSTKVQPYSFDLEWCTMEIRDVICELDVTNDSDTTRELAISHDDYRLRRRGTDASKAITTEGNQYELSQSSIGSRNAGGGAMYNRAVLAPDVRVRIVLRFKNVAESSTEFSLIRLAIYEEGPNNPSLMQYVDFKRVRIQK